MQQSPPILFGVLRHLECLQCSPLESFLLAHEKCKSLEGRQFGLLEYEVRLRLSKAYDDLQGSPQFGWIVDRTSEESDKGSAGSSNVDTFPLLD